jgi:hypothetical protein
MARNITVNNLLCFAFEKSHSRRLSINRFASQLTSTYVIGSLNKQLEVLSVMSLLFLRFYGTRARCSTLLSKNAWRVSARSKPACGTAGLNRVGLEVMQTRMRIYPAHPLKDRLYRRPPNFHSLVSTPYIRT